MAGKLIRPVKNNRSGKAVSRMTPGRVDVALARRPLRNRVRPRLGY